MRKLLLLAAWAGSWATAGAAGASLAQLPLSTAERACEELAGKLGSVSLQDCLGAGFALADTGSVGGRAILVRDYLPGPGAPEDPPRILLFGGIHGDEFSSVSIVFRWIELLQTHRFRHYHWRISPCLNPDGLLARPSTRVNANGVDLNRNFPSERWHERALPYWREHTFGDPRRYPGEAPLSEPESRWLAAQIESFAPQVIISVHAPLGILDFDGPPPPPDRLGYLRLKQLGVYPGSLGNFAGVTLDIPVLTPELQHAGIMPSGSQTRRMWNDLNAWLDRNVVVPQAPPLLNLADRKWLPPVHTGAADAAFNSAP